MLGPSARRIHTQTPRSNCPPDSTHCSQSGQNQEKDAELQESTLVISTMYSHITCPINVCLWRQIQSLKCWTTMAWSCSRSHMTSLFVVSRQASNHNFIFYGTEVYLMAPNFMCSYISWIKCHCMKTESVSFAIKSCEIWCCWFTPKDVQEVKFLFIESNKSQI
jgi:hypothetical protein